MKRTIGFRNFRRFIDFEPIAYDHITYLVGRNNSGKSTVVKALMLVLNYLKSGKIDTFSFAEEVLESANIVTYERAKNRLAKEDFIRFIHGFGPYHIEITITGDEGKTFARVHELVLTDVERLFKITLSPQQLVIGWNGDAQVQGRTDDSVDQVEILKTRIKAVQKELKTPHLDKTSVAYIELNEELRLLKDRLTEWRKVTRKASVQKAGFAIRTFYKGGFDLRQTLQAAMDEAMRMTPTKLRSLPENKKKSKKDIGVIHGNYLTLQTRRREMEYSIDQFFAYVDQVSLNYLGASSTKQPALFAIRDRNNTLAQAIHEYQQLGINPGDAANVFIVNWIKEEKGFEIGDDFQITTRAGEAYEVEVSSHGTSIPLSDKGMGSIQAMLLIFRLACIIHKKKKAPDYRPIVIIEEPELNLHPALQSRLTDLFLEVHKTYGIDFIVETHSEYMVRRTQVLVAEGGYAGALGNNPFTVIYFPKDLAQPPYHLVHQEDGTFDKSFGSGFLDEASKHTLELIRMRREKEQK